MFGLLAAFFLSLAPVSAQPATPADDSIPGQILRQVSGPYDITVIPTTETPTAGFGTRFSVRVLRVADKQPVDGISVLFIGRQPDGKEQGRLDLLPLPAFSGFYQSLVTLNKPGRWGYTIVAEGSPGVGTVEGTVEVVNNAGESTAGAVLWVAVVIVLLIGGFLFVRSTNKRPEAS